MRHWAAAAEKWLLAGRERHIYNTTQDDPDEDPQRSCTVRGTRVELWSADLCLVDQRGVTAQDVEIESPEWDALFAAERDGDVL